ncbi:hypothetical protein ET33_11430 [Paenibacillus tyrfis]|uniref:Uncharacterized protein n=1 Tax=Paenibacillus tyrfis TaxID=1501230 RepID=A0A081NZM1_9BACL|nr:hypothetical protein ET33_11430 [Paenibacillus tyrfis]
MAIKPGAMGKPIPGVDAAILDDEGRILEPYCMGNLAIKTAWPSMMRRVLKAWELNLPTGDMSTMED